MLVQQESEVGRRLSRRGNRQEHPAEYPRPQPSTSKGFPSPLPQCPAPSRNLGFALPSRRVPRLTLRRFSHPDSGGGVWRPRVERQSPGTAMV
jgi:hypothetical protein